MGLGETQGLRDIDVDEAHAHLLVCSPRTLNRVPIQSFPSEQCN